MSFNRSLDGEPLKPLHARLLDLDKRVTQVEENGRKIEKPESPGKRDLGDIQKRYKDIEDRLAKLEKKKGIQIPVPPPDAENEILEERNRLVKENEMAIKHLCYAALEHASEAVTHTDQAFQKVINVATGENRSKLKKKADEVWSNVKAWALENPLKTAVMVVGMGGTIFKSKTIAGLITDKSEGFVTWCRSASTLERFLAFVLLMTVRLIVSTLVPPTSPAFGIIISAATPDESKWTAMPFFLLASTVAGAMPFVLDKIAQFFTGEDFRYTMFMYKFTSAWPLTCWTFPTMKEVFLSAGGGKLGSSLAIIVAHAAPFMGAQTTNIQRYFLPHPMDTIISQPFGMSEDLISMAMAEATSNPIYGSKSLSTIVVLFNFARFFVFSKCEDYQALVCGILNVVVGILFWHHLMVAAATVSGKVGFVAVGLQLVLQLFAAPLCSDRLSSCLCGAKGGPEKFQSARSQNSEASYYSAHSQEEGPYKSDRTSPLKQ